MKNYRITVVAATLGLLLTSASAFADWKPDKPINIIVPWSAGGSTDQVTRVVAPLLEAGLGTKIVVVNQPGASGSIGTKAALDAPRDGYTWTAGAAADLGAYKVKGLLDTTWDDWELFLNGFDARPFKHLVLNIRGEKGGETPDFYLSDSNKRICIRSGDLNPISEKWQTIQLPLSYFETAGIDLSYLESDEFKIDGKGLRGSIMIVGPLLARFGKGYIPKPGGDKIGRRRLDTHFEGLIKLGAKFRYRKEDNFYGVESDQLLGAYILLDFILLYINSKSDEFCLLITY